MLDMTKQSLFECLKSKYFKQTFPLRNPPVTRNFRPMVFQLPETLTLFTLLIPLYTEMHYRFKWFPFNRYFRREPEIIADAPYRIEPGKKLPVLLLIKDAHQYSIRLHSVKISGSDSNGNLLEKKLDIEQDISDHWWYKTVELSTDNLSGVLTLNVTFNFTIGGKRCKRVNHNLPTSPEKPLTVILANEQLPGSEHGWHWGDLHLHTNLTEDQIEFGAPIDATQKAAEACGLSFVCLTDHSYDLDDKPGSWSETDPELQKWHNSRSELVRLNEEANCILVPGEEVSAGNQRGKNIHTLLLNWPKFVPGSGDGAERWLRTSPEHQISDILNNTSENALAIAAHTRMHVPLLHKILLGRGLWEPEDHHLANVAGFQLLNGSFDNDFEEALQLWIKSLLKGQKKYIYAGNDAHGNFNRFRQVKIPMLSVWDHTNQILGKCRTGIMLNENLTVTGILDALRQGRCVISDGPLMEMAIKTEDGRSYTLGDTYKGSNIKVSIGSTSTDEYGYLDSFELFLGDLNTSEEREIHHHTFKHERFSESEEFELDISTVSGYVRGVLISKDRNGNQYHCYTNPIWINHPSN